VVDAGEPLSSLSAKAFCSGVNAICHFNAALPWKS